MGLGGRAVRLAIADGNGAENLYLDTVVTDHAGVYNRTFRAPRTSVWRATYQPASGDATRGSTARSALIKLPYRTQITHYSAGPRVLALGSKLTIRGKASKLGAFDSAPLPGAKIELYWASDGKTWKLHSLTRTGRDGGFTFRLPGRLITIQIRTPGSSKARLLAVVRTNRHGSYVFRHRSTNGARYAASWEGAGDHLGSISEWSRARPRR